METSQQQVQMRPAIFMVTCQSCGKMKASADFYNPEMLSFSNFCKTCRDNFVKIAKIKNEERKEDVPEHMLSRAFKIKHYFVGLKVVPQSRWVAVSNNFKGTEKNCFVAKSITHRTLLKENYMP